MKFGIDYSMTSPACCGYSSNAVTFWYAHESKHSLSLPGVHGDPIIVVDAGNTVSKRAARLAAAFLTWLGKHTSFIDVDQSNPVLIEDYAFSATGRVFHIGENCGILKSYLDRARISYDVVPPTVVKKFATGKGNADKKKMTAAFLEAFPDAKTWIPTLYPRTKESIPATSPLADLADAYWIARYNSER